MSNTNCNGPYTINGANVAGSTRDLNQPKKYEIEIMTARLILHERFETPT